jgi:hypothetical protein
MKARFVRRGGWERTIEVDARLPPVWVVPDEPPAQRLFGEAPERARAIAIVDVLYHRELFVDEHEEFPVYVEDGLGAANVRSHECAALVRAQARINELEAICARAHAVLREAGPDIPLAMMFSGSTGEDLADYVEVEKELLGVAMTRAMHGGLHARAAEKERERRRGSW